MKLYVIATKNQGFDVPLVYYFDEAKARTWLEVNRRDDAYVVETNTEDEPLPG